MGAEGKNGYEIEREALLPIIKKYSFLFYVNADLSYTAREGLKRAFTNEKWHLAVLGLLSPEIREAYKAHKVVRADMGDVIFSGTLYRDYDEKRQVEDISYWASKKVLDKINVGEFERILEELTLFVLITLAKDVEGNKAALAALLARVDLRTVPPKILTKIKPVLSEFEATVELGKGYDLCSSAEPRLEKSFKNGATMLVNEHLLVKFTGRISALCLQTFTSKEGYTFVAGNWYTPMGKDRQTLHAEFKKGVRKVKNFTARWAYVRALENNNQTTSVQLMQQARVHAGTIPDSVSKEEANRINETTNIERQRDD